MRALRAVAALKTETYAVPDEAFARERLILFVRRLRDHGLPISPIQAADYMRSAALLPPSGLYWAGRACLVTRADDIHTYRQIFAYEFGPPEPKEPIGGAYSVGEMDGALEREDPPSTEEGVADAAEQLEHRDFTLLDPSEAREVAQAIIEARFTMPLRRTLRRRLSASGRVDLRRTLRSELRPARETTPRMLYSIHRQRERRLVLVLDVSRSMAPYSRYLLIFAHTLLAAGLPVEVYCFSTRLTALTDVLRIANVDAALAAVAAVTPDRDSGTRIGDAFEALLLDTRKAEAVRSGVLTIVSDGLEQGDPDVLRCAMERLARLAHRIVWVNPLKGSEGYEPLQQGMIAALPSIDEFVPGHNLASLRSLVSILRSARE
jgi:uncharacterized protein with von Willebrand factor type A (vWA) domain